MTYDALRHFADSWGLVFMAFVYLVMIGWALLPRNRETHRAAAHMILDNQDPTKERDNG